MTWDMPSRAHYERFSPIHRRLDRRPVRVLLLFGLWTGLEEAVLNGEGYGRVVERDG